MFFVIWVSFGEGKKRSIAIELRNLYGKAAIAYVFNQDCSEARIELNKVLLLNRDYRNTRTLVGKCSTELGLKEEAKALGYKDVTLTLNLKKSSIINTSYAKVE